MSMLHFLYHDNESFDLISINFEDIPCVNLPPRKQLRLAILTESNAMVTNKAPDTKSNSYVSATPEASNHQLRYFLSDDRPGCD